MCIFSRNNKKEIGIFKDELMATAVVFILCQKFFERPKRNSDLERLKSAAISHDYYKISKEIEVECRSKFFSLGQYKDNTICMIKENECYKVIYKDNSFEKVILSGVGIKRAVLVTRNYACLLQNFDGIYKWLLNELGVTKINYLSLLEYYLF